MSTTAAQPNEVPVADNRSSSMSVMLPYLIAIGAQLPMLFLYYYQLWGKVHYRFYPVAFIIVALIAVTRWPKEERLPHHKSWWSNFLLICGIIAGLLAVPFWAPWFSALSMMLLVASLFARTVDPETGKGMWMTALPLFSTLALPLGQDIRLITVLQRFSAQCTSHLLDLVGLGHHMPGTTIQLPGKEYGVEQACSGVVSFYTLVFVALAYIVWFRRPWFRSLILLLAAVFWAIFMNTVRIFMIPFMDTQLGVDLSEGFAHALLGWATLGLGILMLFSTDQFLLFLFGPVEPSSGRSGPFGKFFTAVWNGMIAGDANEGEKKKRRGRSKVSVIGRGLIWTAAGLMGIVGVMQLWSMQQSRSTKLKTQFFDENVMVPFDEGDLPKKLEGWTFSKYMTEDRTRNSDLGQRSDVWIYNAPKCRAQASMDQTFPGWHELTICYKNLGWELINRERKSAVVEGTQKPWPYIEATFKRETGEKGFLVFSHFDAFGEPYDAPETWGTLNSYFERARNRLSHKYRSRLFRGEAYQTQVFVGSYKPFDAELKNEITSHYLKLREIMRQKFVNDPGGGEPEIRETDSAKP